MKTLNKSYDMTIESAYIITIPGHEKSEALAAACAASCEKVGMPHVRWDAFDGTKDEMVVPAHAKDMQWLSWLKVNDHHLSQTEIACALSHISLWAHCASTDKPLVILEHDAHMLAPYREHIAYNAIAYLGSKEQYEGKMSVRTIPPHGSLNHNRHFICRAHAYAIDPAVARSLLAHVIRNGIHESLDVMIDPDIFAIVQPGLFAYDNFQGETTIVDRKQDGGKER